MITQNTLKKVKKFQVIILKIEIILNSEELDWLDNGNGFCSLNDLPRKDYDDIAWSIKEKLKVSYTKEAELKNEYHIKLTQEEIDYIQEILTDSICDEYHYYVNTSEKLFLEEIVNEWVPITNEVFKKLGIPILKLDFIKNKPEYQRN